MSLLNDQSPGGLLEELASKKPSKAAGLGGPTGAVRPLWDGEIDEADLELFGSISPAEGCAREPKDGGDSDDVPFLHDLTPG
jgi:hypothetical protein